ncbi:MAG TPA: RNA-binding protein [Paracoccus sp. (in: a-proteobacteria)]|uniref:RNA-binding protein n=1 Tax=uncultured Paracoccus sp. TaxID=189685 RepID=UPI002635DC2B|nr:RNA-binding protein [uncultured Paracoccus sp.]HMQ42129.1 RNA-binding protein [Paracoccus sp. (in: a-proteobacteria)]HMR37410.1 RNA-binding protein [Paracoccus sp. (in: a-proteobacteria)]
MTRGGRDKTDEGTERRCLVTGEVQPKAGLIRFVLGPDGMVVPDLAEKLPGRGFWLTADRTVIEKAVAKGAFSRGAKAQATPPEGLIELIETGLARRVIELVSLGRKSGVAVAGFEKVKDWLAAGRVKVLLQASDGSERGKGKLWTPEGARWFGCLTASELGLAFGRDHVIHSALSKGGLADKVIRDAGRLNGLRGQSAIRAGKE